MIMTNYIHDILNEFFFNYYEDRTRHNNFLIKKDRPASRWSGKNQHQWLFTLPKLIAFHLNIKDKKV